MIKNRFFIQLSHLLKFNLIYTDKQARDAFFAETSFINIGRLKIFIYFLIFFLLAQFVNGFVAGDYWEENQTIAFFKLDLAFGFFVFILFLATHIRQPKSPADIKRIHFLLPYLCVFVVLIYSTGIATVESVSANSVPSYIVVVFAVATIFLLRGFSFFVLLLTSVASLFAGLSIYAKLSFEIIYTQYGLVVILILLAWTMSRVLFNTRIKSFSAKKDVEEARNNLDRKVRERTEELNDTNIKLVVEIKERKKYEKRLEQEKKKAMEADRLKSVFLANMSHEIRTPLNGILGFSDLLRTPDLINEKKERYLEVIHANGQQLLKIIDDIMDISMIESNQLKINVVNFRLSQVLPSAIEFFTNYKNVYNKSHIELEYQGFSDGGNDHLNSDPTRIQQVLYSLLSNAIKFTEKGSIRYGVRIDEGYAMVIIEDTGIGIKSGQCETIFERFRQGEESISRTYGGTGLGLSITKGIIDLLGGLIWVDLAYTLGSRFCFVLPTEAIDQQGLKVSGADFKLLDYKVLLVTNTEGNAIPSTIYELIKCKKTDASHISLDRYEPQKLDFEPKIIIFDMLSGNDTIKHISQTAEFFPNAQIMAIAEQNDHLSLKNAGCTFVYKNPLNVYLMLLNVKEILS